jgi:hypothetical protein
VHLRWIYCGYNTISTLDFSKNTKLEFLATNENPISALDLAANTVLKSVVVRENNFSAAGLNDLFRSLHGNPGPENKKFITYAGNPGTATCDPDIYLSKGWFVQ